MSTRASWGIARAFFAFTTLICVLGVRADPGLASGSSIPTIVTVKFVEGLEIRLSEGRILATPPSDQEIARALQNRGLDHKAIEDALKSLNALLKDPGVLGIHPLFSNEARGLRPEGPGPPKRDLGLYFMIALKDPNQNEVTAFVARLQDLPIVETAYVAPIPEDARTEGSTY
ncbi:MAG: hypothetical protein E6K63_03160 [Nitrospirae bacterium]|nr:MAG: hypothetical protein E6K63_03160 [Nitrospirota bacterium]